LLLDRVEAVVEEAGGVGALRLLVAAAQAVVAEVRAEAEEGGLPQHLVRFRDQKRSLFVIANMSVLGVLSPHLTTLSYGPAKGLTHLSRAAPRPPTGIVTSAVGPGTGCAIGARRRQLLAGRSRAGARSPRRCRRAASCLMPTTSKGGAR
jgi:hypothetical protein